MRMIVNPEAGGGRARENAKAIEELLGGRKIPCEISWTRDSDDVARLVDLASSSAEQPVVVGGDGTVGVAAGTLAHSDVALGVVPSGRGNDLARVLGIPTDPASALEVILDGSTRRIDLGEANGRRFVGIASLGFDSDANRIANDARMLTGSAVYAYAAVKAWLGWRPARFEVRCTGSDSETYEGWSVAIANNSTYGGGMRIAPDARLDDGLFDVVMVSGRDRLGFARMLPTIYRGGHLRSPYVKVVRARRVQVDADRPFTVYADGDALCDLPMTAEVIPSAIALFAPRERP